MTIYEMSKDDAHCKQLLPMLFAVALLLITTLPNSCALGCVQLQNGIPIGGSHQYVPIEVTGNLGKNTYTQTHSRPIKSEYLTENNWSYMVVKQCRALVQFLFPSHPGMKRGNPDQFKNIMEEK